MRQTRFLFSLLIIICLLLPASIIAGVSQDKAVKIAKKNLNNLTDQTYHYRIDYDSVIAIPVHSKIKWKNDFYLVYFLNNDYFEAEVEVDKETGNAVLLALKKMSQPYYELHTGTFNHRYFTPDSISVVMKKRHSLDVDSLRLVFFGVIPKLGKRGVIWEAHYNGGIRYQSLSGAALTAEQIVRELNSAQREAGNYTADEIRMGEINRELKRLEELTEAEIKDLKLSDEKIAEYKQQLDLEKKDILLRFTDLGKKKEKKPGRKK